MTYPDAEAFAKSAPLRCPSCDLEWQDHPGIARTCEDKERLFEALEKVLPYCRPPVSMGVQENMEYIHRVATAEQLLKEFA